LQRRKGWATRFGLGSWEEFRGEEVAEGFAAADQLCGLTADEDFGGAGAGVVVRGLGHAVGSGIEQDDEIVGLDWREGAVAGEEVSGLADGAHYIYDVLV
jgi:hypothetical protein